MHVWKDKSLAWPVANPVVTCASVSDSGFPSNFVADPFLYVQVIALLSAEICWVLNSNKQLVVCKLSLPLISQFK